MSPKIKPIDTDDKRDRLLGTLPKVFTELDPVEQAVSLAIYRQLATGSPVEYAPLAETLQLPLDKLNDIVTQWTAVYHDDDQRIIGYWGLSVGEMPHRMLIDNRTLFAWCAWDSLFIPPLLGKTASVQSRCAVTNQAIELTVSASGVDNMSPSTTVMSFIATDGAPIEDDIINQFCHYVLFFQSEEVSGEWLDQHPGTFLMSVDDGFALGQRKNQQQYSNTSSY